MLTRYLIVFYSFISFNCTPQQSIDNSTSKTTTVTGSTDTVIRNTEKVISLTKKENNASPEQIVSDDPQLVRAFPDKVSILDLKEFQGMDEIHLLKEKPGDEYVLNKKYGIILYNDSLDIWTKYDYLKGYEVLGFIRSAVRINNMLVISFENGGLIVDKEDITSINYPVTPAGIIDSKLICIPDMFHVKELISYDTGNKSLKSIKLEKSLFGIVDQTHDGSAIWVATLDNGGPDYWYKGYGKITLDGKVEKVSGHDKSRVYGIFRSEGEIMLVNEEGVFTVASDLQLDQKTSFEFKERPLIERGENQTRFFYKDPNSNQIILHTLNHQTQNFKSKTYTYETGLLEHGFKDFKVIDGEIHSLADGIVLKIASDKSAASRYIVRSGKPSFFEKMIEDDKEAWFLSADEGLTRFSKLDSTWKGFNAGTDVKEDSVNYFVLRQLTMNEDFVFATLTKRSYSNAVKYLILNRKTEKSCVLSKEDFVQQFFFNKGEFADYNGTPFCHYEDQATVEGLFHKLHEWTALLYFYDLPLHGIDYYDHGYKIISNEEDKMLLARARWSRNSSFYGILHFDKMTKRFKTYKFPNHPNNNRDFWDVLGFSNYRIAGIKTQLYIISRDDRPEGIIELNLNTNQYIVIPTSFDFSRGVSLFSQLGDHLVIGGQRGKIFLMSTQTDSISNINYSDYVRDAFSSSKYHYINLNDNLLYFDKNFKLKGDHVLPRFQGGGSRTYFSGESVYVMNPEGFFRVEE